LSIKSVKRLWSPLRPIGIARELPNFTRKHRDLIEWLFWFFIRFIKEFWYVPLSFFGKGYTVEVAN